MAISLRNLWDQVVQKLNPAQALISREAGWNIGSEQTNATVTSWEEREVIQRGVSMIVSGCSLFDVDIKDKKLSDGIPNLRKAKLDSLLNHKPNPFQDIQKFKDQVTSWENKLLGPIINEEGKQYSLEEYIKYKIQNVGNY